MLPTKSASEAWVEAQTHGECGVSSDFMPEETESVERILTEHYGLPWVVTGQELRLKDEKCGDHAVTEPKLVFTLTQTESIVHPLQDVARTHLCCVELDFGSERVSGILDTGAQHSLLNTLSYERMKSAVLPLLQPLLGAGGFVGA